MKLVAGRAAKGASAALRRRAWLTGALLLNCCGGNVAAESSVGSSGSSNAGSGGGTSSSSGTSAAGNDVDGGQSIYVGVGGVSGGSGGADVAAGAAGAPDMTCDISQLLRAILLGAVGGLGECEFAAPPGASEKLGLLRGAVVLDSVGRVIDNTGLPPSTKQAWLAGLINQRWVCLAGQTVGYKCGAAG